MIKLIEKQKIIISHYREGKSQRQIERDLGINRRTIRKYIKDYERKKAKFANSKSHCNKYDLKCGIFHLKYAKVRKILQTVSLRLGTKDIFLMQESL